MFLTIFSWCGKPFCVVFSYSFCNDFAWFNDNLLGVEKRALEQNCVLDGFFLMNPRDPEMAKKAPEYLKGFK